MILITTKKQFRKLVDEAMEERVREAEARRMELNAITAVCAKHVEPADPHQLEIVMVHRLDKPSGTTEPEVYVRPRPLMERGYRDKDHYEVVFAATLTEILSKMLRALATLGVDVVHHQPLRESWELRKRKITKEDER